MIPTSFRGEIRIFLWELVGDKYLHVNQKSMMVMIISTYIQNICSYN